jgi:hypothetical protein
MVHIRHVRQSSANIIQHAEERREIYRPPTSKEEDKQDVICYICGETEHFTKKCYTRKGSRIVNKD